MVEDTQLLIESVEEPRAFVDQLRQVVVRHANIVEFAGVADREQLRLGDPQLLGREKDDQAPFVATVFDPVSNRAAEIRGRLDRLDDVEVTPSAFRPTPQPAELRAAAGVLRRHEYLRGLVERPDVVVYQPMPPLADQHREDGTSGRRPTLGIYDPSGSPRHRIVAVDVAAGAVDPAPAGVDLPTDADCESTLPVGVDSLPDTGGPNQVRVRVIRGGEELWNIVAVRPRASAPTTYGKGSGIELRQVRYRGRLLLWQAHVPILNVLYDDGVSYRDWQNQETPFLAEGHDPVGEGWRACTQPPATILEAGTDAGDFQGVALWYDNGELRLVSELQAGWYRYISDWRLRDDGTIRPRFGFAGTRNPRTCMRHHHHVYWRLDFDVDGAGNDVVEQLGLAWPGRNPWRPIRQETSRKRSFVALGWQVLDRSTGRGYRITPGPADGTADSFGVADLWVLHYHPTELDDGVSVVGGTASQTQARLDQYINSESVDGTDLVVWYAGHFLHDQRAPSPHQGHIIGPELRPLRW